MNQDDLGPLLCGPCLAGQHPDCQQADGCECAIRRGPDGRGVVLCAALLDEED